MERPLPENIAARHEDYLASSANADKKAAQSTDEIARKALLRIAGGYRDLAAMLVRDFKL
jgi:hypothetical protein